MSAEFREDEKRRKQISKDILEGGYNSQQAFFLLRLNGLKLDRLHPGEYGIELSSAAKIRLLDKAIYSTFIDCRELGVGDDANKILSGYEVVSQKNKI
ncbi:hypothetical protein HYU94_00410 [Candidatus Daviesbacteria bacterium]|nr:hypothetical protein [Candidatus Daviesbacteria bacterium]